MISLKTHLYEFSISISAGGGLSTESTTSKGVLLLLISHLGRRPMNVGLTKVSGSFLSVLNPNELNVHSSFIDHNYKADFLFY